MGSCAFNPFLWYSDSKTGMESIEWSEIWFQNHISEDIVCCRGQFLGNTMTIIIYISDTV